MKSDDSALCGVSTERSTRRRFLRGMGGSLLALPWFESLAARAGDSLRPPPRMAVFYVPIGVIRQGFFPGEQTNELLKFGGNFERIFGGARIPLGPQPLVLPPTLSPLEKMRHKITLITGMDRTFQNGTDVHAQCASCFMSSAEPYSIKSSAWPLDRTLDQLVADRVGRTTPFRSLELSCNSHRDNKESIYFDNISWYGTGHVAPSIRDPRRAYQRLFGTTEVRRARNITDLVLEDARTLENELGSADRQKFSEYIESLRAIEQQMDRLERMKGQLQLVSIDEPPESQLPRGEYIRMMGELMIVALQTGLTRVATLMIGPERWDTPLTYEGLFDKPVSHHQMSHDQKKYVTELLRLDLFHMQQFAYLVEKMDSIGEAAGTTLLDNTLFTFGSGLGDGATHQYNDLPIIVAGSGGGRIANGLHLNCADGTPLSNLWLTQAQIFGHNIKRYADSTGPVAQLLSS